MEQLKAMITEQVKNDRILKMWVIWLVVANMVLTVIGAATLLYFIIKPSPASQVTLEHIETEQKTVALELKLIQSEKEQLQMEREAVKADRADARQAREQLLNAIRK